MYFFNEYVYSINHIRKSPIFSTIMTTQMATLEDTREAVRAARQAGVMAGMEETYSIIPKSQDDTVFDEFAQLNVDENLDKNTKNWKK